MWRDDLPYWTVEDYSFIGRPTHAYIGRITGDFCIKYDIGIFFYWGNAYFMCVINQSCRIPIGFFYIILSYVLVFGGYWDSDRISCIDDGY